MRFPKAGRDRRAEDTRRIHRGTSEGSTKQNIERDRRADRESRHAATALVDSSRMHNENEKERQDRFDQDSLRGREIDRELRRAGYHDIPSEKAETNQGGGYSTQKLRDPVTNGGRPSHMSAADQSESHGRIQVAARDMHRGGNEGGNRQAVGQRNRQHIVPSGLDSADADENECKCSDEFCDAGA